VPHCRQEVPATPPRLSLEVRLALEPRRSPARALPLPEVVAAVAEGQTVYVCEGEKDADAARALGVCATCNPGGAGKWQNEHNEVLAGASVVVIGDADNVGRKHATAIGEALAGVVADVRVLEPLVGKDLSDHLAAGHDLDALTPLKPGDDSLPAASAEAGTSSLSDQLLALARVAELFQTPEGEVFATFPTGEHAETWAIESKHFERWLAKLAYVGLGWTPSAARLGDVVRTLSAIAVHDGPVHDVHVRVAEHDGLIIVDLADPQWQAVLVGPDGWEVVQNPPVRFRRSNSTRSLPIPVHGGEVDELRRFVNVTDEGWLLFSAWLVAALRPTGPYPILDLVGEQGSAKSTAARVARELVDPNAAPLRSAPADGRDLMIAANNSWVLALDNLSRIRDWLSDALCRLSTGGGFATRELYTNTDETVIEAQRPVILTGIGDHATRSDLLDRELLITLPAIGEDRRQPEKLFWQQFEEARPRILGALFDAVALALAHESTVTLPGHPRMADFAVWASASAPALGFTQDEFLDAYDRNRGEVNAVALEDAPIAPALLELAKDGFHGTASELLEKLAALNEAAVKRNGWPKSATSLSGQLRRLAPNFRQTGVEVEFGRNTTGKKDRFIDIHTTGKPVTDDTAAEALCSEGLGGDEGDAGSPADPEMLAPEGYEPDEGLQAPVTTNRYAVALAAKRAHERRGAQGALPPAAEHPSLEVEEAL